jgi:hypothetical protein
MPIQLIIRNPLDRDAREFVQRAGVSDAGGRSQINEFVRGVKGLGLWDSMVCWPLRSTQNAGTGTTAYSLGGFATANGTLVNGPTWGADGVDISNDSNQHIATTYNAGLPAAESIFAVNEYNALGTQFNVPAAARSSVGFTLGANWSGVPIALLWDVGSGLGASSSVSSPTDGSFNSITGRFTRGGTFTSAIDLNGTQRGTNSSTATPVVGTPPNLTLGSEGVASTRSLGGKLSFVAHFNTTINSANLHNLYKATLGTGLGLP